MGTLIITRANDVLKTLAERPVAAVLSIEHPGATAGHGAAPRVEGAPQMILCFWDSEQPVPKGPTEEDVKAGILFVLEHLKKGDVLIHCHAGKSRSVAIALGVLALRHPEKNEKKLMEELLKLRPMAAPNILMVEMADKLAGRGGRLAEAVRQHPQITAQRKAAEMSRQSKKISPEKFI